MKRRLAAILAADAVGYSRLMGEDEEATLQTLNTFRAAIDGFVAEHEGRVFTKVGPWIGKRRALIFEARKRIRHARED